MTKTAHDYRELLRSGRWFHGLPAAFQDCLIAHGVVRQVKANEVLFLRGDAPDGLYAVLEGVIRVSNGMANHKEAVLAMIEPPQWFGEIAVFDSLARTHDAVASEDSVVLHVSTQALNTLLTANPLWWRDLALLVTSKLRMAFVMLEDVALLPLLPRLARRLVMIAEGYGEFADHTRRVVKVRQELLAAMVNASRQSTNQALKELEGRGLIMVAYGEIEILDLHGLAAL